MRKLILIYALLLLSNIRLNSQNPCASTQLFVDLAPNVNDREIEVNVKVHVFVPTTNSNSSVWHNTGYTNAASVYTDAVKLIDEANRTFTNIAPTPSLGGVTTFTNAKIKLVLYGFYLVEDDNAYESVGTNSNVIPYEEDHAINVFFGGWEQDTTANLIFTGDGTGLPAVYPHNMIRFHPTTNVSGSPAWDNIRFYGNTLAHEIGHVFGLHHSSNLESFSAIVPDFGCCAGTMSASDYVRETTAQYSWTNTPHTNNLMSHGAWNLNLEYLSPQQEAIMHFNARTKMLQFLSANGYTAATVTNPACDYTVQSNETWTSDRYFKGSITVKSGYTLTIQCGVAMTNKAKIIIEPGAKLHLDGGTITNISGRLWEGIDVMGSTSNIQALNYQGFLEIDNGTISNSINAARNYGTPNGQPSYGTAGGIITAWYSKFLNNVRDVEFLGYPLTYGSASEFDHCEFKTTDTINDGNAPYVHVSLWSIKGVNFESCTFENAMQSLYPNVGQAIHSIDAIYSVSSFAGTLFKGFNEAVSVVNSNPTRVVDIDGAKFVDNKKGIEFSSVDNSILNANTFTLTQNGSIGIAVNKCKGYSVSNNTITGAANSNWKAGVYAVSSGNGSHWIYRNDFRRLYMGISPQYDNSGAWNMNDGLYMNCNTFTAGTTNTWDIAMQGSSASSNLNASVARWQGLWTIDPKDLVRNQYGASCTTTNGPKKWFIDYSSSKQIEHDANSDAATRPVPQPTCSSLLLNIINSGQPLTFSVDCEANGHRPVSDPECPCKNCCRYDDISLGLSQLLASNGTLTSRYNSNIDGGDTQSLLDAIASGTMSSNDLKNVLASKGPYLSDEVLTAFITSTISDVADVISIHGLNKPVSAEVWEAIEGRSFSGEYMSTLEDQQDDNPISERSILEGQLSQSRSRLQDLYRQKINYFMQDTLENWQDTVIKLYAENLGGLPEATAQRVNAYANGGYYERAFEYADSLKGIPEHEELMTLQLGLLQLDTAVKKIYKIMDDGTLFDLVKEYAEDSTKAGFMLARAVLNEVYGRDMHLMYMWPEEDAEGRTANANSDQNTGNLIPGEAKEEMERERINYFKIYPNPTNSNFNVIYRSPGRDNVHYEIHDLIGKEIMNGNIRPNMVHEIKTEYLNNGIYFITLLEDNQLLEKRKLIIMK
jgi:hypothetical protein